MTNLLDNKSHQKALEALFAKKMTRKQFLLYMSVALIGMTGIKSFMDAFLQPTTKNRKRIVADGAYGGGSYSTSPTSPPNNTLKGKS